MRNATVLQEGLLPTFGVMLLKPGHDFTISSDCNLNYNSKSNFGIAFELPKGFQERSEQTERYLAGSHQFRVEEIEVFKITL